MSFVHFNDYWSNWALCFVQWFIDESGVIVQNLDCGGPRLGRKQQGSNVFLGLVENIPKLFGIKRDSLKPAAAASVTRHHSTITLKYIQLMKNALKVHILEWWKNWGCRFVFRMIITVARYGLRPSDCTGRDGGSFHYEVHGESTSGFFFVRFQKVSCQDPT